MATSPARDDLHRISDVVWEIPQAFRSDMRVPARVLASEKMLDELFRDRSLWQLVNVATLPGVVGRVLAMPDVHEGYGFPIGGVAATRPPGGVISPGGIGYDINCGVRLLASSITARELGARNADLARELFRRVPSGVGRGGMLRLGDPELTSVLREGARRMIELGYGEPGDLGHCESGGALAQAEPENVSARARDRGRDQLGTMGAGNHFVEVQRIERIFEADTARVLGLFQDQVTVLIHTGSRGLGHQVATDYLRQMVRAMPRYGVTLPDRELACVPFGSPEGQRYFGAMAGAANFAWANRQLITHEVRQAWESVVGGALRVVYDVAHNIAKIERYTRRGAAGAREDVELVVHRKGATRAFWARHPEIVEEYRNVGQPVLIPGSMGTASYVLVGAAGAERESFGSCCHGAGRRMSRTEARREVRGEKLQRELEEGGIAVASGSSAGLAEEAPLAYKDVDEVVDVVHRAGVARRVARLKPIAVIKG